MGRWAGVVVPGVAHHATQRGNRRQETFFDEEEYAMHLSLWSEWCDPPSAPASPNKGRNRYSGRGSPDYQWTKAPQTETI